MVFQQLCERWRNTYNTFYARLANNQGWHVFQPQLEEFASDRYTIPEITSREYIMLGGFQYNYDAPWEDLRKHIGKSWAYYLYCLEWASQNSREQMRKYFTMAEKFHQLPDCVRNQAHSVRIRDIVHEQRPSQIGRCPGCRRNATTHNIYYATIEGRRLKRCELCAPRHRTQMNWNIFLQDALI